MACWDAACYVTTRKLSAPRGGYESGDCLERRWHGHARDETRANSPATSAGRNRTGISVCDFGWLEGVPTNCSTDTCLRLSPCGRHRSRDHSSSRALLGSRKWLECATG